MPQASGSASGLTNIGQDRCANLRWKGLFIEAEWDPTVPHGNDRAFLVPAHVQLPGSGQQARGRLRVQSGPKVLRTALIGICCDEFTSRGI